MSFNKMGSADHAAWLSGRGYGAGGAPDAPAIQAAKMVQACAVGDAAEVDRLLAQGASPITASAVEIAFDAGHGGIALALIEAAGWGTEFGRSRAGDPPDKASPWAAKAASPDALENVSLQAEKVLDVFARGRKWAWLSHARDLCDPAASDASLVGRAFEAQNMRLALDASQAGARPSARVWRESIEPFAAKFLPNPAVCHGAAQRHCLSAWLAEPANVAEADQAGIRKLFAAAVERSDAGLMAALLDAGLTPGQFWSYDKAEWDHVARAQKVRSFSLVWEAAKLEDPETLRLLLACPPALAAAKARKEPPKSMAAALVGRVVELHEAGVPVDGVSQDGGGLAHAWAQADHVPRSGWATLMKRLPEVFDIRDAAGRAGADLMAAKLGETAKAKFLADMAKREGREIKSAVDKKPAAAAAPKRRL